MEVCPLFHKFRTVVKLALGLALAALPAHAASVTSLTDGAPALEGQALPTKAYVEVKARKLKQARVVWVNWDWLLSNGIEFPREGLTPEFERQVLDAFGWKIPPQNSADPTVFGPEEKVFKADRYGGQGLGLNEGSGRAASAGKVQLKGIGVTPLVDPRTPFDHAHGSASLEEALREAIWGEIGHQELPHGANRVVAILDTGTFTDWRDGGRERNALIVREDPIRPAHYIPPTFSPKHVRSASGMRIRENFGMISKGLPTSRVNEGLKAYAENLADQYAAAYASRFFHGATSESNIELSGRFLDFGTMSAQPDYGNIKVLEHMRGAEWAVDEVKERLVVEFSRQLRYFTPDGVATPEPQELGEVFQRRYESRLSEEMLKLAGIPPELAPKLSGTPEGQGLARALLSVARAKLYDEIPIDKQMPERTARYRLGEVLSHLSDGDPMNVNALQKLLTKDIADSALRKELAERYSSLVRKATQDASELGIKPEALLRYIGEATRTKNAQIPELHRPVMRERNRELIDEYLRTGNREALMQSVDSRIQYSRRRFDQARGLAAEPFALTLRENRDPVSGRVERLEYDARADRYQTKFAYPVVGEVVDFHGHIIPVAELERAQLRYSTDGWKTVNEVPSARRADYLEFVMPQAESGEFVLRSADSTKWWKSGEQNLRFSMGPFSRCAAQFRSLTK